MSMEVDKTIENENAIGTNGVECDLLNSQSPSTEVMERHRRYPHEGHDRTCRCPYCLYTTFFLNNHRRHLFKHDDEKEQECHLYDRAFIQKDAEIVGSEVRNSLFSSTGSMENHKRKHQELNHKYQCTLCLYSTKFSSHLQNHLYTHTGEKRHKCHICHKAFTQKSNLKTHLIIHSGQKFFTCGICSKSFNLKGNLRGHMRTHSSVKPYRCPICKKDFILLTYLKKHIHSVHSQQRTYDCPTEE